MANVKISQLPSLTTMTDAAEIPVVAGGVTYQITGANLTNYFGSGGNTGNITFDAANISTNLANTDILIAGNGTGNVQISTADGQATWTFDATGNLTVYGTVNAEDGNDLQLNTTSGGEIDINSSAGVYISAVGETSIDINTNPAINFLYLGSAPSGYLAGTYTNQPTSGGTGTGLTVDYTCAVTNQPLTSVTINNFGSGYSDNDTITIDGGNSYFTIQTLSRYNFSGDNLTLPFGGGISFNYGYIDQDVSIDGDALRISGGNSVIIRSDEDGKTWKFAADGNLTLPNNANIATIGNVTQINTGANGFLSLNSFDASGNNIARVGVDSIDKVVFIGVSDPAAEIDYTWGFGNGGGTLFPTLTVDLHNGDTQTGQTLQFGDPTQQAFITGPTPAVDTNAQRLIIQGQRGSGTGEGGDVYVWGGDSDINGGDIKIYAGDADSGVSGRGGNIHISGGTGQNPGGEISLIGGQTYNGQGAPVVIAGGGGSTTGGNVDLRGGGGDITGGPISLVAGSGLTTGGNVDITGGQSAAGLPGYGNVNIHAGASSWAFDNTGKITLPHGASLNDTSGDSVAFGQNAGLTSQAQHAVAIGINAGSLYQGEDSVAIGYNAGYQDQGRGVAIGWNAGRGGTLYKSVNTFNGGSGPVTTYDPVQAPNPSRLYVASTANIVTSQRVFGNNIQANTVVTAVYVGEDRVDITPNYTAAMSSGDTLTFVGLDLGLDNATNVVTGMRVTGNNLPANTFVQNVGCSVVTLSQYPTAPLSEPDTITFSVGQGFGATAVGYQAGSTFQGDDAVAVGRQAGYTSQNDKTVAVGGYAGYNVQGNAAVAVGYNAGQGTQGINAVAVGYRAGQNTQGARAVAIGEDAGYNTQGEDAVAIGQKAGQFSQGLMAIAIGNSAGYSGQTQEAVAIGYGTGLNSQQYAAVAIGANAASYNQGSTAVAIGHLAGNTSQGASAVAVGDSAGYNYQSGSAVAVGVQSGYNYQSQYAVAIGSAAGQGQGYSAVYQSGTGTAITITPNAYIQIGQRITGLYVPADTYVVDIDGASLTLSQAIIGTPAVDTVWTAWGQQGISAVAIGQNAALDFQGNNAVAIGTDSGSSNQSANAVAIGYRAGFEAQGSNTVSIGTLAGQSAQGNNSIILNATGVAINSTGANTFTVAPVRNDVANTGQVLFYNTTSKEITYGNTVSVAGNITGGNLSAVDLVINRISSDDSSFITIEDGVNVNGAISATGSITGGNVIMPGSGGDITMTGGNITGAGTVVTTPVALSSLTTVAGGRAFVNDGNLVAASNFGSQIGGGGSNVVPVWSDGTNWYVG